MELGKAKENPDFAKANDAAAAFGDAAESKRAPRKRTYEPGEINQHPNVTVYKYRGRSFNAITKEFEQKWDSAQIYDDKKNREIWASKGWFTSREQAQKRSGIA